MTNKARSQRLGKGGGAMPPYEPWGAELTQESSGPVRTYNGTVTLRNDEYIFHLSFGCVILNVQRLCCISLITKRCT